MQTCKIGIIGCGDISKAYLHSFTTYFRNVEVTALSSLHGQSAYARAQEFHIPTVCQSNEALLSEDIDIAVVLTDPMSHYAVVKQCLLAGKHTYVEKPLATSTKLASELIELARQKHVMLCCAPDTILGSGMQTARRLIEHGSLGTPIASLSQTLNGGPESWHPNPAFLYKQGAGPLYDVGPYYIAGLCYLFGPVRSVSCAAKTSYPQRTITSQPQFGKQIRVEVPTFYSCILNFCSGVISTTLHSFDVPNTRLDTRMEIYGTNGTLLAAPPCDFSGETSFKANGASAWTALPPLFASPKDMRGLGVADMADALLHARAPRLSDTFAYHVLDVIESLQQAAMCGRSVEVQSSFTRTAPMRAEDMRGLLQDPRLLDTSGPTAAF